MPCIKLMIRMMMMMMMIIIIIIIIIGITKQISCNKYITNSYR